jgi:hypothetical protein
MRWERIAALVFANLALLEVAACPTLCRGT